MNNAIQQIVARDQERPRRRECDCVYGGNGATIPAPCLLPSNRWGRATSSAAQINHRLRPQIKPSAGGFCVPPTREDLRIGGRPGMRCTKHDPIDNVQDLFKWGPILLGEMKHLPGLQDVTLTSKMAGLDEVMNYDRVTAASLALP